MFIPVSAKLSTQLETLMSLFYVYIIVNFLEVAITIIDLSEIKGIVA